MRLRGATASLSVTGASSIDGSLIVSGATTLSAAAVVLGSLSVSGAATISSGLSVSTPVSESLSAVLRLSAASSSYSGAALQLNVATSAGAGFRLVEAKVGSGSFAATVFSVDGNGKLLAAGNCDSPAGSLAVAAFDPLGCLFFYRWAVR